MKILILIFASLLSLSACGQNQEKFENQDIIKIEILNRTSNKYIKFKCVVLDSNVIKNFSYIFNKTKPVERVNTQANRGFYETILNYKDGTQRKIFIIYTTYSGVIITDSNENYFKNDALENIILWYFQTEAIQKGVSKCSD